MVGAVVAQATQLLLFLALALITTAVGASVLESGKREGVSLARTMHTREGVELDPEEAHR